MIEIISVGATATQEKRVRTALKGPSAGALMPWPGSVNGDAARSIADEHPATVVLGSDLKADDAIRLARRIEEIDPTIATVLFVDADTDTLRRAIEAGVRGIIRPDAKSAEVKKAVAHALETGHRLQPERGTHHGSSDRFITLISAKGGTGKTVVSSNLAVELSLAAPERVALVDLDLQFGDIATSLLLSPRYSMSDAVEAAPLGLEPTMVKAFLTTHADSGLCALCAPDEPAAGEEINSEHIGAVLDVLASEFAYVVVDTDPGLSESALTALERSTDIIVLVDLDVPSVRGTRKLIDALDRIGMTTQRRHVVLNRANSHVGLDRTEVVAAIGVPIDVTLPSTRHVPLSLNEGRPLSLSNPRSAFGKGITSLAQRLAPVGARRKQHT
jgi:pilus assembly protein CpaE